MQAEDTDRSRSILTFDPKCDLELWATELDFAQYTPSHHGEYLYKIILKSFNAKRIYRPEEGILPFNFDP